MYETLSTGSTGIQAKWFVTAGLCPQNNICTTCTLFNFAVDTVMTTEGI
jgi:hypothetical protein